MEFFVWTRWMEIELNYCFVVICPLGAGGLLYFSLGSVTSFDQLWSLQALTVVDQIL